MKIRHNYSVLLPLLLEEHWLVSGHYFQLMNMIHKIYPDFDISDINNIKNITNMLKCDTKKLHSINSFTEANDYYVEFIKTLNQNKDE